MLKSSFFPKPALFERDKWQFISEWQVVENSALVNTDAGWLSTTHFVLIAFALRFTFVLAHLLERIDVFRAFKGANDTILAHQGVWLRFMAKAANRAAALAMADSCQNSSKT